MLDWISLTVFVLSEGRYWSLTQRQLHCAEDAASPITTRTEVNVNTVIGGFTRHRYSHLFASYWLCVSFHAFFCLNPNCRLLFIRTLTVAVTTANQDILLHCIQKLHSVF